ncbi:hypothetical protein GCM10023225_08820 [Kineococcus glutinatus]|uniref:DUF1844 domain-containing protein n=1 Tax=Kineococcus glutinatus TaxID=1070872 RepID=A0ABP9HE41_9ACTN
MADEQEAPLELRLYGMMQALMAAYANRETPPPIPERGAVEQQDALDAVMQLAAVIDEFTQAGGIPPERGVHAGAMLMVVRDYIKPLPPGLGADGRDRLTDDLHDLVAVLRQARQNFGHQG